MLLNITPEQVSLLKHVLKESAQQHFEFSLDAARDQEPALARQHLEQKNAREALLSLINRQISISCEDETVYCDCCGSVVEDFDSYTHCCESCNNIMCSRCFGNNDIRTCIDCEQYGDPCDSCHDCEDCECCEHY